MNSAVSEAALIGLDWGTSSFRAYLIGNDGRVLEQVSAAQGIMAIKDRDFEGAFRSLLSSWSGRFSLPVIASGMITSRNGWVETPYVPVPAGKDALASRLVPYRVDSGLEIHFVPGLSASHDAAPDVMRGEEVQVVGALAEAKGEGPVVLPGTHSKWVKVEGGEIVDFHTFMTGEVFAALKTHTILGTLMTEGPFSSEGFEQGVRSGLGGDGDLLHRLFHVRTLPLFDRLPRTSAADYLSGLLIGSEIRSGLANHRSGDTVTLIGRGDLTDRYACALTVAGLKSRVASETVVASGLFEIAKSAGLIS